MGPGSRNHPEGADGHRRPYHRANWNSHLSSEPTLGVFEFVIVLVVVTTIGKVVSEAIGRRQLPPGDGTASYPQVESLRDEIADLGARLHRLEEERDFYKDLLDAPEKRGSLQSPRESEE